MRAELETVHKRGSFPGASLAFVLPDKSTGAVVVGTCDADKKRALAVTDRLMSGSIGKTYVAGIAMLLVVEKKLDLDAKLSTYLGDEEWFESLPNADDITIRQLMNHASGLLEYVQLRSFAELLKQDPNRVWEHPERITGFVSDTEPLFPAGKGWSYADTNYVMIGLVIEKITGQKFYDLVRTRLLEPFALKDTVPNDRRVIPGLVNGFSQGRFLGVEPAWVLDGEQRYLVNPQFEWCGGGFASTTLDLARWGQVFYGGDLLKPEQLAELHRAVDAPMLRCKYGIATMVRKTPFGQSHGHDGFMPGYLSYLQHFVDRELTIALQFNTDHGRSVGMPPSRIIAACVRAFDRVMGTKAAGPQKAGPKK